jgi:hypothetical protein
LSIATPIRLADYRTIASYLARGRTLVYVEEKTRIWYLVILARCGYLSRDNRCRVYFDRPKICREYTTADCEYDEDWIFEKVFETAEQILEYAEATLSLRARAKAQPWNPPGPDDRSFTLPIDPPTCWDDYDAVRWYLAHGTCRVYLDRNRWFLVVTTEGPMPPDDQPRDRVFETPEQVWEYAAAILPPRRPSRPEPALTVIDPPKP